MKTAEILDYAKEQDIRLWVDGDLLKFDAPKEAATPTFRNALKQHKPELIDALTDLHEAREERAAILEYDQEFTHKEADAEAARRINHVFCGTCIYWTGNSPCGAGFVTTGDDPQYPDIPWRICPSHTLKWKH